MKVLLVVGRLEGGVVHGPAAADASADGAHGAPSYESLAQKHSSGDVGAVEAEGVGPRGGLEGGLAHRPLAADAGVDGPNLPCCAEPVAEENAARDIGPALAPQTMRA